MPQTLRILIAEDHETVREGLKLLIDSQTDMEVCGEAGDGAAAVSLTKELKPDVVMMDVTMPELNGLKATQKLVKFNPDVKIVTLTRHTDNGYLQELLKAGASGYILKQSPSAELLKAIRVVAGGGKYLDPAVTDKVIVGMTAKQTKFESAQAGETVTPRELEVLRLIAWGFSNKEIAAQLDISVKTVEAHKANSMRKLDMRSRIDVVRYAILNGWLEES